MNKGPAKRHALTTRLWHWTNAAAFVVLFMSGLNISNAHRALYWGDYGYDMSEAWLIVTRFPAWMTIPQRYDLAEARDWHNLSAWIFALGLLVMWAMSLVNRHFARDIATSLNDWRPAAWRAAIKEHAQPGDHGDKSYNAVQKISYGLVLGIGLPLMIATGLAISPGFEVTAPWLVEGLGGRQSARSLHFLCAWGLAGFVAVHLIMVLWSGPLTQIGRMITGGRREGDANA